MIIFPAIDLKDHQAVRLIQGDFKQQTVYHHHPLVLAKSFEHQGATHLHVVDLDGAKLGEMIHQPIIKSMIQNTQLILQVGGGIRSLDRVEELMRLGVNEVIVGSIAVENKELLKAMIQKYPKRIIVSIDAKDAYVLTRGWQSTSSLDVITFAKSLEEMGITKIIYTDVSKDGMLLGPNFEDYKRLIKETNLNIIASGGVTTLDDIKKLRDIGLYGAIVGKAIYERIIDLKEAIACSQNG